MQVEVERPIVNREHGVGSYFATVAVVTFQFSDPIGADISHDSLTVKDLMPNGQADTAGVQIGWRLSRVGDQLVRDYKDLIETTKAIRSNGENSVQFHFIKTKNEQTLDFEETNDFTTGVIQTRILQSTSNTLQSLIC
jgi:C-terminal processing protease CtpA/Prc